MTVSGGQAFSLGSVHINDRGGRSASLGQADLSVVGQILDFEAMPKMGHGVDGHFR